MSDLEAGEELDTLIAEKVFGLVKVINHIPEGLDVFQDWQEAHDVIEYAKNGKSMGQRGNWSRNLWDAFEIVDHFRRKEIRPIIVAYKDYYECSFVGKDVSTKEAPTVQLAICRAALLAVEKEPGYEP